MNSVIRATKSGFANDSWEKVRFSYLTD